MRHRRHRPDGDLAGSVNIHRFAIIGIEGVTAAGKIGDIRVGKKDFVVRLGESDSDEYKE